MSIIDRMRDDWNRRADGPVIGKLMAEADKLRDEFLAPLLVKMNGKLTEEEKEQGLLPRSVLRPDSPGKPGDRVLLSGAVELKAVLRDLESQSTK